VKDVTSPGKLDGGRIRLPVEGDWSQVFFALEGPRDESAPVEVHHADNVERVAPASPDHRFAVSGRPAPPEQRVAPPSADDGWAESIANEGVRRVFLHVAAHGTISEEQATQLLGGPRAFRRFSLEFDDHVRRLPFRVVVMAGEAGKTYVKEGSR
jgi:hypothetical protein